MQDDQQLFLSISIQTKGERLYLAVTNSFSKNEKEVGQLGGVGLSNVRKRLELLYPGSHELRIENDEQHFIVNLELDLKPKDDAGSDS